MILGEGPRVAADPLLGFVQIYRSGRLIPLNALKRLALIAALALSCNQPVSLDDLTDAV